VQKIDQELSVKKGEMFNQCRAVNTQPFSIVTISADDFFPVFSSATLLMIKPFQVIRAFIAISNKLNVVIGQYSIPRPIGTVGIFQL